MQPIFVALCGRTRLLLEGLMIRLEREPGFRVCGLISEPELTSDSGLSNAPDIVVQELSSAQSAEESLARTQRRFPDARVVLLYTDDRMTQDAASPFRISACDSLDQCVTVIREVAGRQDEDSTADTESVKSAASPELLLQSLNPRQLQIFALLAGGSSVKEVATAMGLTFKAIDSQKYRIMRKLGVTDRVQATRLAIRAGLLNP